MATDIATRGIDIDSVTHVIQYELPNVPEAYVHRIGRTARAGAKGSAVAFCADDERNLLKDIQKVTRQTIPAFDRRNDRGLGAATAAMPEPAGVRPERQPNQGRNNQPKSGNRGNRGRSGNGGGQSQAKPSAQRGAGFKGPRREGAKPAARTGVWSNR